MNAVAEPLSPPATPPRQGSKPLLNLWAVCSLCDSDEDAVLGMVKSGSLAWAWNIALDPKGQRRDLRVLPAAVAALLKGQLCNLQWPDVFKLVLPEGPIMLAYELAHMLSTSREHIYHLVERQELVGCSTWRRGPHGSARIPVTSVVNLLQTRRYP